MDSDFSVYACGQEVPPEAVIAKFELEAGFRLPADFREFSKSALGGVYIEVKEDIWPRAKPFDVAPFWSFLYGMFVHGFGREIPDWMDIRVCTPQFRQHTNTRLVPFLKVLGDADVYCFDEEGAVRRWDHETGEAPVIQKSFLGVFEHEVGELRKRKDRKRSGMAGGRNPSLLGD